MVTQSKICLTEGLRGRINLISLIAHVPVAQITSYHSRYHVADARNESKSSGLEQNLIECTISHWNSDFKQHWALFEWETAWELVMLLALNINAGQVASVDQVQPIHIGWCGGKLDDSGQTGTRKK